MDVADHYRTLADRFDRIVRAVPPDRWDAPSPCAGWTARDVLAHVTSTQRDFLDRFGFGPADLPDDPVVAWHAVRAVFQEVLDDPTRASTGYDGWFGPTTFERTADQFHCGDLVVHGWDLARAAGLADHEAIEAAELSSYREHMHDVPEEMLRQPGVFGPAVDVAADASEQDRFLAWTGRDPHWAAA